MFGFWSSVPRNKEHFRKKMSVTKLFFKLSWITINLWKWHRRTIYQMSNGNKAFNLVRSRKEKTGKIMFRFFEFKIVSNQYNEDISVMNIVVIMYENCPDVNKYIQSIILIWNVNGFHGVQLFKDVERKYLIIKTLLNHSFLLCFAPFILFFFNYEIFRCNLDQYRC